MIVILTKFWQVLHLMWIIGKWEYFIYSVYLSNTQIRYWVTNSEEDSKNNLLHGKPKTVLKTTILVYALFI